MGQIRSDISQLVLFKIEINSIEINLFNIMEG